MQERSFSITYDYLCPFARNANEHVIAALKAGAPWDVHFVPFSLHQAHIEGGDPDIWDNPSRSNDILAMETGLLIRERYPDHFLDAHISLFAARHDNGGDITDEKVIRDALAGLDVDTDELIQAVRDGAGHEILKREHGDAVDNYAVFGVPTFIVGDVAAFTRVMTRPGQDTQVSIDTVERVLNLLTNHPELNEIKQTKVPF
jgi:hypothetical protein